VAFPLGLIALGLILNLLYKVPAIKAPALPTVEQIKHENIPPNNLISEATKPAKSVSESSILDLGASANGSQIRLLLNSLRSDEGIKRTFSYQLGNVMINATANCSDRSWITYPEKKLNRPQSPATEQMLSRVCVGATGLEPASLAVVHDPPSNVRVTPAGALLCKIHSRKTITVGQPSGDWYSTSACGPIGFIHRGQIQF
jgi:serine/threonine protein kinase, bacterial